MVYFTRFVWFRYYTTWQTLCLHNASLYFIDNRRGYRCAPTWPLFTETRWCTSVIYWCFFLVKITICQLGGMFEIENKMVVIGMTSSLYCNIPDCVCKHVYKLRAHVKPVVAPVLCTAYLPWPPQRFAVRTKWCLYQIFINLANHGHLICIVHIYRLIVWGERAQIQ